MIDKKKLKDVMKKQDLKQEKPTDPSMTLDVKNEDVEAQIDLYLKEKTGENLNKSIIFASVYKSDGCKDIFYIWPMTCACSGKFK